MSSIEDLFVEPLFLLQNDIYQKCKDEDFIKNVIHEIKQCKENSKSYPADLVNKVLHIYRFNTSQRDHIRKYLIHLLDRYNEE